MKYMGSKGRIAKDILEIILENRYEGQAYVEPFVGGGNSLDKVTGYRIASDINPYLIALFKHMQSGDNFWIPFISEVKYQNIKKYPEDFEDWIVGYAGFQLSFGAKWFGGYRRDKKGIDRKENEIMQNGQAERAIRKQAKLIKDVFFYNRNYWELGFPERSIIYCDPPYEGTTAYTGEGFDHRAFWGWCEDMYMEGHSVFVSEYNAPKYWECVWEKEVTTGLDVNSNKKDIERLFVFRPNRDSDTQNRLT